MFSTIFSAATEGIEAYLVNVEIALYWGLPGIHMVGLPSTAVQEAKERVRSALKHSGFEFPRQRITINLAPAHTRKAAPVFDLAIAIGLLQGSEQIQASEIDAWVLIGELSLNGSIRSVQGVLPFCLAARAAGKHHVMVPHDNIPEASLVKGIHIYGVRHLKEAVDLLTQAQTPQASPPIPWKASSRREPMQDFADVIGQEFAKRGLEIAAAGGHNIMLIGPPGTGKTMLAERTPGILPSLTRDEALEITKIYSIAGLLNHQQRWIQQRPFRHPHHTLSSRGLIGGSVPPRPGEISLAHHGILFLDELLEFSRQNLEMLRQPLEDGQITLVRQGKSVCLPSQFMLVAALNPCPCGYYGDTEKNCRCSEYDILRYWRKLSAPLLDRFDIFVELPRISTHQLHAKPRSGETTATLQKRVTRARQQQYTRNAPHPALICNARLQTRAREAWCALDSKTEAFLTQATQSLNLSPRSYHRLLKVSRTIADLAHSENIQQEHLSEALQFRHAFEKYF